MNHHFTAVDKVSIRSMLEDALATEVTILRREVIRHWSESRVEKVIASRDSGQFSIILKHVKPQDPEPRVHKAIGSALTGGQHSPPVPCLLAVVNRGSDVVMLMEFVEGQILAEDATQENYRTAVAQLADIHGRYWCQDKALQAFDVPVFGEGLFKQRAEEAIAGCRRQISRGVYTGITEEDLNTAGSALSDYVDSIEFLAAQPRTLTHGDFHYGNVFLRQGGGIAITDWGSAAAGIGLTDVIALIDVSRRMGKPVPDEADLVSLYHEETVRRVGKWVADADYRRLVGLCRVFRALEELRWFNGTGDDYGRRATRELEIIRSPNLDL